MMRFAALLLLAGCAQVPDVRQWLKPCHIAEPEFYSSAEATRVANLRHDALLKCNNDKAQIAKALKQ